MDKQLENNEIKSNSTPVEDGVILANIGQIMMGRMLNYGMSVLTDRALPDIRDGLKPVARRLMYTAHTMGLRASQKPRKSASLVGEVMGKYHPHGDSSIYGTAVYMAQPWVKLHPLFDGQGNWGSIDGDREAAMRYTEVRLSKTGEAFFDGLEENSVDFQPNYDQTLTEPTVLPVTYPSLLVNGTVGIAVGMASSIPTHNLRECLQASILLMKNPNATTEEIMSVIPAPDLPTGGVMYDTHNFANVIDSGRGSVRIRATYKVEHNAKREVLVLTSLPYLPDLNKARVLMNLSEAVEKNMFPDIVEISDESKNMEVRVVIKLKAGASADVVFNQLLSLPSTLDVSIPFNINVLKNGRPCQVGIKEALISFNEFSEERWLRRSQFRKEKFLARVHIIDGLLKVMDNLDEAIAIIRSSKTSKEAASNLMARFELTEVQTSSVLAMRLSSLTSLEVDELKAERTDLVDVKIAYLTRVIEDKDFRINEILNEYQQTMKTLGRDRVCKIDNTLGTVKKADYITQEKVVIHLTKDGYIKRMPSAAFKRQARNTQGKSAIYLNKGDVVKNVFEGDTHDLLMAVTTSGMAYSIHVWDIPEGDSNHKGRHLNNLMPQLTGKEIADVLFTPDFKDKDAVLVMATEKGKIKVSELGDYAGSLRSTGIAAMKLADGDKIVSVRVSTNVEDEIIMVNNQGLCVRFDREEELNVLGRNTQGVGGMRLSKGAKVLTMDIVPADKHLDSYVLIVGDKGVGKYTQIEEFRRTSRNTKGTIALKPTAKSGEIAFAMVVYPKEQDLLLCTKNKVNRVSLANVSEVGRYAAGVKLIDLIEDDSLVNVIASYREQEPEQENLNLTSQDNESLKEETKSEIDETPALELENYINGTFDDSDTESSKVDIVNNNNTKRKIPTVSEQVDELAKTLSDDEY